MLRELSRVLPLSFVVIALSVAAAAQTTLPLGTAQQSKVSSS